MCSLKSLVSTKKLTKKLFGYIPKNEFCFINKKKLKWLEFITKPISYVFRSKDHSYGVIFVELGSNLSFSY